MRQHPEKVPVCRHSSVCVGERKKIDGKVILALVSSLTRGGEEGNRIVASPFFSDGVPLVSLIAKKRRLDVSSSVNCSARSDNDPSTVNRKVCERRRFIFRRLIPCLQARFFKVRLGVPPLLKKIGLIFWSSLSQAKARL